MTGGSIGGSIGGWEPLQSLRLEGLEDDFYYSFFKKN